MENNNNKNKDYFNHCWQCGTFITSETAKQCRICGWYICPDCGACEPHCSHFDADRYDRDGYNINGFDKNGIHKNGTCYDNQGFNKEGYDKTGYNRQGFNRNNMHRNGTCFDDNGLNVDGLDVLGDEYRKYGIGTKVKINNKNAEIIAWKEQKAEPIIKIKFEDNEEKDYGLKTLIKNKIIKLLNFEKQNCVEETIKKEIEEENSIIKFLKERGITSLIHFTNVKNLKSILEYGVCSNEYCLHNNISYFATDKERLDGLGNYISFSLEFPNYKMFYDKRENNENRNEDFIVLEIDAQVLGEFKVGEIIFSTENAASNVAKRSRDFEYIEYLYENDERRKKLSIPSNYPTNPQAEVLIKERVPSQYIKKIHTNDFGVYYDLLEYVDSGKVELNSKYFKPRCDWEYWQKRGNNNG